MTQDLSNYDHAYYQRDVPEFWFGRRGLLRPDQLAAICYIYGLPFWGNEPRGQLRVPGPILSFGAGAGHLEAHLEGQGELVLGVDPAPGARERYAGRDLIAEATVHQVSAAGTIVFCESIEHIPIEVVRMIRDQVRSGTRLIVVNWPDYHPLLPDSTGWDHITLVDDALYDELSVGASVWLRRGSHLVLDVEVDRG